MNKEQKLKDSSKKIIHAATNILLLENLCMEYAIPLDASPLTNFRDALFHYIHLYDSEENSPECHGNVYAIDEHLSRGVKDIIVYISYEMRNGINHLHDSDSIMIKNKSEKVRLLMVKSEIADLAFTIRGNFGIYDIGAIESYIMNLTDAINQIKQILKDWGIPMNNFIPR